MQAEEPVNSTDVILVYTNPYEMMPLKVHSFFLLVIVHWPNICIITILTLLPDTVDGRAWDKYPYHSGQRGTSSSTIDIIFGCTYLNDVGRQQGIFLLTSIFLRLAVGYGYSYVFSIDVWRAYGRGKDNII